MSGGIDFNKHIAFTKALAKLSKFYLFEYNFFKQPLIKIKKYGKLPLIKKRNIKDKESN